MTEKKISQVPMVNLAMIFSREEISGIERLWVQCNQEGKYLQFHANCLKIFVEPAMERINKITGQENDADYIAYAIEFALMQ